MNAELKEKVAEDIYKTISSAHFVRDGSWREVAEPGKAYFRLAAQNAFSAIEMAAANHAIRTATEIIALAAEMRGHAQFAADTRRFMKLWLNDQTPENTKENASK